ncbi:acyl-CoA dehydrogenase family protein [Variovorax sp. HW608]|uniref:acyl-CoA dehydrogenase family protein n=1 Tax=Variovorax sp. HW608 TaxID=1034889 RepID=UPI003FCD850A
MPRSLCQAQGSGAPEVAAARIAAEGTFWRQEQGAAPMASAVAKARASEAAHQLSAIAHAVHGAIGVTEEYDLQLYTRRLHEWRLARGCEAWWNRQLGRHVLTARPRRVADVARQVF